MQFLKLLLGFAPWLAFLFIAHGSLFRLKLGLAVAAILTVVMAITRLHKGIIMWVGIVFFAYASIAVLGFTHMWTIENMNILPNAALTIGTWITLAIRRPFTLEYAKEHTDPSRWKHPLFIRTNVILTSMWGAVFTVCTVIAVFKTYFRQYPEEYYEFLSYAFMFGAIIFTSWYPGVIKRRAAQAQVKQ